MFASFNPPVAAVLNIIQQEGGHCEVKLDNPNLRPIGSPCGRTGQARVILKGGRAK